MCINDLNSITKEIIDRNESSVIKLKFYNFFLKKNVSFSQKNHLFLNQPLVDSKRGKKLILYLEIGNFYSQTKESFFSKNKKEHSFEIKCALLAKIKNKRNKNKILQAGILFQNSITNFNRNHE